MSDYFRADNPADHITTKLENFHIDRIVGEPTIDSYDSLIEQLCVGAALIKTTQWGGKFGHIPIILEDERFRIITNDENATTEDVVAFDEVDPNIDANTPDFEAKKLARKWDAKIRAQKMQEEVKSHFVGIIVGAVDEEYIIEKKVEYVGYANETPKSLLKYIKKTWCKVTTLQRGKALANFREPWDNVVHISAYSTHLDKAQLRCQEMGVEQPDSEKVQIYVSSMYASDVFEEKEMVVWENRLAINMDWEQAKNYFGALYKQRRSFNADMKAHRAGYESANSIGDNRQFNSAMSLAGLSTTSGNTKPTLASQYPEEFDAYTTTLEDALEDSKDYAASISTKANDDQSKIMLQLEA